MKSASRCTGTLVLAALAVGSLACRRSARRAGPGDGAAPHAASVAAASLKGHVSDAGGHALPEARVVALGPESEAGPPAVGAEARADRDGVFVFSRLVAGRYTLLVEAVGLAPARLGGVAVPGPDVTVPLAGLGRALEGVVSASGTPAAGARVRLAEEDGPLSRTTMTDASGTFVLHGLGAGPFTLSATRGALVAKPLSVAAGPVRLELEPGVVVEGVVVDDLGRPLTRAVVEREDDPTADVVTAGADGRFRAGPFPLGRVSLVARAAGYLARGPTRLELGATAPPPSRLELARAAVLEGRVVDARGAAVAGAEVRCAGAGVDDLAVIYEPLPPAAEAAALAPGAGRALAGARTVRTDARGAFRFAELLPGPLHLEISHAPSAPLRTEAWPLGPGERRDVGVLALRDGVIASGRVVDEAGRPVAGARVSVMPASGTFAETDGTGAFSISLPAGRYTVEATAPGAGEGRASLVVDGASPPPSVELRLSRADGTIVGVARDSGNRPVARARVRAFLLDVGAPPSAPPPGAAPLASTVSDAGGHFSLAHVPRRPVLLALEHPDYPPLYAPATAGVSADLTVPIPGGVDGEVRERVSGAALAGARVDGVGPGGQRATASVSGKGALAGAFRVGRLAPGRWTLTATAKGYGPATRDVEVPASPTLGEATVRGFRLELERAAPARP